MTTSLKRLQHFILLNKSQCIIEMRHGTLNIRLLCLVGIVVGRSTKSHYIASFASLLCGDRYIYIINL